MNRKTISIIVPTLNERENVQNLVERIHGAFNGDKSLYEIIFIDDHSTDGTYDLVNILALSYPIFAYLKKGKPGKAFSLLEGFVHAEKELIGFIDADLQYPPEALPLMIKIIEDGKSDIVVAHRVQRNESYIRNTTSKFFAYLFGKLLHDLDCDIQSGLKVFKKQIIEEITVHPSKWTFDLEFLLNARNAGYKISSCKILFDERKYGESKINLIAASWEIGYNALKMKFKKRVPSIIKSDNKYSMLGAGIAHNGKRFITHTTLDQSISAIFTFATWQKIFIAIFIGSITFGLIYFPLNTIIVVILCLSSVYFIDTLFNLFLVMKSMHNPPEINFTEDEISNIDEAELPVYSILCPLYKEADVLPGFLSAISEIDWPKEKLDVLLLLEQNDPDTIAAADAIELPSYVRTIIVPHSMPKTKPKACNYGLSMSRGKYVVIYDAEDIPEPSQLKKAYLAFEESPEEVKCLQAKLNYFNSDQNMLTRLFTAEYTLWFDIMLPALQSINTFIPLGGTSNHFRVKDLLDLKGWDPFNVTEDADLGARLFKLGYRTAIIDSLTLEEANSQVGNWIRQRSRWIKGYMQTYLVHMRNPFKFIKECGIHAFIFQLNIGLKTIFALLNPILWITTILYFAFREKLGPLIESIYPGPVFYLATFALIFGNFMYLYNYMIACAKREKWHLIKFVYFIPFYWFLMSIASYMALWQLFVKPHFWEKTRHGLSITKPKIVDSIQAKTKAPALIPTPVPRVIPTFVQSVVSIATPAIVSNVVPEKKLGGEVFDYKKPKSRLSSLLPESMSGHISGTIVFMIAAMVANFLNFLFNAFLGRVLSFEEFGLIAIVNTIWSLIAVFMNAFAATVNRQSARLSVSDPGSEDSFFRFVIRRSFVVTISIALLWVIASPYISSFFNMSNPEVILFFTPIFVLGAIGSASRGFLNGNLFLKYVAAVSILEAGSKFVLAFGFWNLGLNNLVYLSIPISIVITAVISWTIAVLNTTQTQKKYVGPFPFKFFSASLLNGVSVAVFMSVDILLAKHFLSPVLAGQYALISLAGKMIFFLGSLPNFLITPLISREEAANKETRQTFKFIFIATLFFVLVGFAGIGIFGYITVPLLFGIKSLPILPYLLFYTFGISIFTISNSIVVYHLVRKQFIFSIVPLLSAFLMIISVSARHESVLDIVNAITAGSIFSLVSTIALILLRSELKFIYRAVRDFKDAFRSPDPFARVSVSLNKKKILILNWRDTKHVYAGGAEMYVQEIAKEWVKEGHTVTIFSGNDGKNFEREIVDGVHIVRRGGFYLVYFWAFLYYITQFRNKYDLIIDCHNGIPFFTPLYAKEPVFCLMHHVHQEVFTRYLPAPLAFFARFLENGLMPIVYKKIKFITVSKSSLEEIVDLGLGKAGIEVVNPGVDQVNFSAGVKSQKPTVLYLGRFKAYKSIDVLLRAFKIVLDRVPEAELILAGSGDEEKKLKLLTLELEIQDNVVFAGKVCDEAKLKLLQKAWVAVNPSLKEGWGITTIEANACGTPVIASNVPGLRDSVSSPYTGYLVEYGDIHGFADCITKIIRNNELRSHMNKEALQWASNFSWEKTSKLFLTIISDSLASRINA